MAQFKLFNIIYKTINNSKNDKKIGTFMDYNKNLFNISYIPIQSLKYPI
jgi:hypothetical protein